MKSVNYASLVVRFIEAVKEQQKEIEMLKNQVIFCKSKIRVIS